jgi:cytoskeletal protein RodZ
MSLINDALKRASEAQAKAEPAATTKFEFRGVEPGQNQPGQFSWYLGSVMFVAVLITALVFWETAHRQRKENIDSSPPTSTEKPSGSVLGTEMKVHAREDGPLPGAPLASTKSVDAAQTESVAIVAVSGTTIQESSKVELTNSTTAALENVRPAPKLQAIVYNPTSPSAIISGKTVFAGDRVGEWRVVSVGRDSATIVKAGETNVLKLGE